MCVGVCVCVCVCVCGGHDCTTMLSIISLFITLLHASVINCTVHVCTS